MKPALWEAPRDLAPSPGAKEMMETCSPVKCSLLLAAARMQPGVSAVLYAAERERRRRLRCWLKPVTVNSQELIHRLPALAVQFGI